MTPIISSRRRKCAKPRIQERATETIPSPSLLSLWRAEGWGGLGKGEEVEAGVEQQGLEGRPRPSSSQAPPL